MKCVLRWWFGPVFNGSKTMPCKKYLSTNHDSLICCSNAMASIIKSLRLLADATRLRLLLLLLEQAELTVAEIQEILNMGQSRISAHLAQLKRAGLVLDRRAGKNIYYGLAPVRRSRRRRSRAVAGDRRRERQGNYRERDGPRRARPRPAQARGPGAGVFQPAGGQVRPQLLSRPLVARDGAHAAGPVAADGHRRPRRGRGHAFPTAGA